MLRPELKRLFEDYAAAHRHPMNQLTHKVAIPLIMFNTIAMFDWWRWIELADGRAVTSAHVGIAISGVWYLSMHPKLGVVMIALMIACLPLGWIAPVWLVLAIGVIGWVIQLAGHKVFEKNSPAFLENMVQALVGPLFFLAILTREWPGDSKR